MAPANDNLKPLLLIADIPPVMATIPNIPRIIPIIINQFRTAATSNSAPKGEPGNPGKNGGSCIFLSPNFMVGSRGFEPLTSCV